MSDCFFFYFLLVSRNAPGEQQQQFLLSCRAGSCPRPYLLVIVARAKQLEASGNTLALTHACPVSLSSYDLSAVQCEDSSENICHTSPLIVCLCTCCQLFICLWKNWGSSCSCISWIQMYLTAGAACALLCFFPLPRRTQLPQQLPR